MSDLKWGLEDTLDKLRRADSSSSFSPLNKDQQYSFTTHTLRNNNISSNVSLPSLVSDIGPISLGENDFVGSIPFTSKKTSLFGSSSPIPVYRKYNVFSSPVKKKQVEKVSKQKSLPKLARPLEGKGKESDTDTDDEFKSMLGEGYKFDRGGGKVYCGRRKRRLGVSKKVSKHSTVNRKLKPTEMARKITKEIMKVPGPMPRVMQRTKIKREHSGRKLESSNSSKSLKQRRQSLLRAESSGVRSTTENDAIAHWDKYLGSKARENFFDKYKEAGRHHLIGLESDWLECPSPREQYLSRVVSDNLIPLTVLLRKEREPKGLCLGHKGLGDAKMLPVIHVLEDLPTIETIDLSDNRLTDESLMPLVLKLPVLKNLTSLNLSDNKIDESSQVIMDYLQDRKCKLKKLYLDAADVDDNECGNLANSILENRSIDTLSLRNNMIGKSELLNVVYPELVTGGEALGEMLCHNKTITDLDVSWNFIRLDSACELAQSLHVNNTLKVLKLAYNAFGDIPTQYLGKAIKENRSLKYLDVQYNSITPRGATVLANALLHNDTLETLILDGNVLGDVGAQAVVAAIQRSSNDSRNLDISFEKCDCTRLCPDVFNAANPGGKYTLDMTEPYGQMVCEEILYLANYRAGCMLGSVKHKAKGSSDYKTITLIRPTPKTAMHRMNCLKFQKRFAEQLLNICEKKLNKAKSPTRAIDTSQSPTRKMSTGRSNISDSRVGSRRFSKKMSKKNSRRILNAAVEKSEESEEIDAVAEEIRFAKEIESDMVEAAELCKEVLEQFDLYPDSSVHNDIVEELMSDLECKMPTCANEAIFREDFEFSVLYHIFFALFELNDIDDSGDMDVDEFLNCLGSLGVDYERGYANKLLQDFDLDKSGFIDNQEFAMIMVNEFCRLDQSRDELVDKKTKKAWVVPSSGEVVMEVSFQCEMPSSYDVSHDEGIVAVIKSIRKAPTAEQKEIIFVNATISPYFYISAQQAMMLFEEMGKHAETGLDILSRVLPQLVTPEQCHRFIDSVLSAEGKFALRVKMGQSYNVFMGLYSGHYTYDLKHRQKRQEGRALAAVWSVEMMYMKKNKCDTSQRGNYSNFRNEVYGGIPTPITATWFASCPTTGKLRLDYVSTMRPKYGNWPLSSKRFQSMKCMLGLSSIMKLYKSRDYTRMSNPNVADDVKQEYYRRNTAASVDSTSISKLQELGMSSPVEMKALSLEVNVQEIGETDEANTTLTLGSIKEYYVEYMASSHHYHSIYPEEKQRDVSRSDYDPESRPSTPEMLRDIDQKPSLTKYSKIFPFAYIKLLKLQLVLPSMFLSVDQVMDIVQMFPPVDYLRVQAFVSMFSRIVDYDKNGVRALDIFSRDEQSELLHRVGILNLMDPISPDRLYRLDLRRWDHRETCKIMIQLAISEPGENWLREEYRWSKYDVNVPGWTLPMQWTAPDNDLGGEGGPRRHGWCCFEYTSTGEGCAINWKVRRKMRQRVLCGIKRNY